MQALRYHHRSRVLPRLQWNANSGYCGETSFICAGLNFGQYCSQWTARKLFIREFMRAYPGDPPLEQYESDSQLMVGDPHGADVRTATEMRLRASEFDYGTQESTEQFIVWMKRNLMAGHVPIIGVFNNGIALGEWTGRDDGDPEYDHIVPVLGWASDSPLEQFADRYLAEDVITLSDNGLYGPCGDPPGYPFIFFYEVAGFPGTRKQANNPAGPPLYTLNGTPPNYGIAIEGVLDHDNVCIPVHLSCDKNHAPEPPELKHAPEHPGHPLAAVPLADEDAESIEIVLTATVESPGSSVAYNLYRYDDFAKVPVRDFNKNRGSAAQVWTVTSSDPKPVVLKAASNETVVFRAVPTTAP